MGSLSFVALERHRQRRAEGVPTVSVLLGDGDVWEWLWRRWQRSQDIPVVALAEPSLPGALEAWLGSAPIPARFRRRVLERAASRLAISVGELEARIQAHAPAQLEGLIRELGHATGLGPALLQAALRPDHETLPRLALEEFPRRLAAIAALLGDPAPALLARAPEDRAEGWLAPASRALLSLAEAWPRLELALITDERELERWQASAPARDAASLREGLLRLTRDEAPRGYLPAGLDVDIIRYDEQAFARSRAERELFQRLNRRPRTEQLFELNSVLPERFGSARLEVDLLCESLQIAVEIDGYHHFRDAAAYRRDRSKDVLLQGLGYTVVRVLASDVMGEIDFVLSTIDQVVEQRHRSKRT